MHDEKKQFFCRTCDDFFCEACLLTTKHSSHDSVRVDQDLERKREKLATHFANSRSHLLESNFSIIENFKKAFEKDYYEEKQKIKTDFNNNRRILNKIEKDLLKQLDDTKRLFLLNKFKTLFDTSEYVRKKYNLFYETKENCPFIISFLLR